MWYLKLKVVKVSVQVKFSNTPVRSNSCTILYSATDCDLSNKNISKIPSKNRISICEKVKDAFISSTFTKEEKDALYRITLNLKQLHKFVPYEHFKMESLTIVVNIIE